MKKNLSELWREHKMLLVITSCIILLQTLVGMVLWNRLPDQIATHFDFHNQPDGWTSKAFTVFGMPLVLLALHWITLMVSSTKYAQIKNLHSKVKFLFWWIIPSVSLLVMVLCYGYALGAQLDIGRIVIVFLGLVFAVTGNYIPKVRRNYSVGIKLPWTMTDDENWHKTHRMAAPIWVVCGLLLIVLGLTGITTWVPFGVVLAMILLPTVYSLALHIKKKKQ
ncbi:MAG: SdpI family protein [Clostridia bacterium]|nr:SdpI family protein [Clostridia bacterium]